MPRAAFNAQEPAHTQEHDYDCSQDSLEWALYAVGRQPADQWLEQTMLADGIMSTADGLLDGSGARLAAWIGRQYGEFGFSATSQATVSFGELAGEAGRYPVLIGGHNWGGPKRGHWSAVRGYDPTRDVLLLANPGGSGPRYGGQEMSRQQFEARGPFSMVRLLHPDLDGGPIPAAGDYRLTADGVRLRAQPGTSQAILIPNLRLGAPVTSLSDQLVRADGHLWRNVRASDGQVGWVAEEFLQAAS